MGILLLYSTCREFHFFQGLMPWIFWWVMTYLIFSLTLILNINCTCINSSQLSFYTTGYIHVQQIGVGSKHCDFLSLFWFVYGDGLCHVHKHVCNGYMCKPANDYIVLWVNSCTFHFSGLLDSRWGSQNKEPHKDDEGSPSDPCRSPNPADWYPHTEQPQGMPILTCIRIISVNNKWC